MVMNTTHWDELEALFEQALDLPAEKRAAFLDNACGEDTDQRKELASLLRFYADASSYFVGLEGLMAPTAQEALQANKQLSEAPGMRNRTGTTVAHYEVLDRLGGGGMGVVYRARDTRLSRTVALKFLPPHLSVDNQARQRFIIEAKAASALDHPNLCTIHEIGENEQGELYIAMACYEGETLKEKIARGPLPPEEALDYVEQIAQGLTHAHAEGILHRDIKPANVMITGATPARERGLVKILDFGLAKMADTQLTRTGTTMGTVAYMSPEQARSEAVDHRTDLWSLGVVLYEMLAGQRPFQGDHEQGVLYAVLNAEPLPLFEVDPALSPALWTLVQRCLEKDPTRRYGTAAEFLADLEMLTQGKTPIRNRRLWPARRPKSNIPLGTFTGVGILAALILILLLAFPAVRVLLEQVLGRDRLPEKVHLAVLPFEHVGPDATAQPLMDGLAGMLASRLRRFEQFQDSFSVEAVDEIRKYQVNTPKAARQVFGANMALTGRVLSEPDHVLVTLTLVDTETLLPLQTLDIEDWETGLARLHEDVFAATAALLDLELTPAIRQVLVAGGTAQPGAYGYYHRGKVYLRRYEEDKELSQLENAIRLFEQALTQDQTYALAHAGMGEAYSLTGRVLSEPDHVLVTLTLVDTETLLPLQTLDIEDWETGLARLHEDVFAATAALLDLELTPAIRQVLVAGGTAQPGAYGYYHRGKVYLRRYEEDKELSQLENAIRLFEQALAQDQTYALAHAGMGEAYWQKYELTRDSLWVAQAKTSCNRAVELSDQLAPVYATLGHIHWGMGEYGSARVFFEQARERDPFYAEAYRGLALTYQSLNEPEKAEDTFHQAIALKPDYWRGYNDLGLFYWRYSRYREALAQFQQVVWLAPDNERGHRNIGATHYFLGDFDEAIAAWKLAEEIKPTYEVYTNLATVYYFEFQNFAEAAQMYEAALQLQDTDYRPWEYLGAAYHWSGQYEKAREAWQSQIERAQAYLTVNARDVETLARLAVAHARLDEPEQARSYIQRARAETPKEPSPLFLIGIAYERLGERKNALTWIGKALDKGLPPERIDEDPWLRDLKTDPDYERLLLQKNTAP